jgi:two-component system, cell cycle sensor histidine kinase and response regulator CckA
MVMSQLSQRVYGAAQQTRRSLCSAMLLLLSVSSFGADAVVTEPAAWSLRDGVFYGFIVLALMALIGLWFLRGRFVRTQKHDTAGYASSPVRKISSHTEHTTEILLRHSAPVARMGSWSFDVTTRALSWSTGFPSLLGFQDKNMPETIEALLPIIPAGEHERVVAMTHTLLRNKQPQLLEVQVVGLDNLHRWLMIRADTKCNAQGQVTHVLGIAMDISDRHMMEESLRFKEQLLRRSYEAAGLGIWEYEKESGRVIWSGEIEALFGIPAGSFTGTYAAYLELIHPDDVAHVAHSFQEAMETAGEFRIEHRTRPRNGVIRWLAARGDVVRNEQGQSLGMTGIVMDVTSKRQAIESLRKSEERYRTMINTMTEGVVIHDAEGKITDCNSSAEQLLGLSKEQIVGKKSTDPQWQTVKESGEVFPPQEHPSALAIQHAAPQHNVIMGIKLSNHIIRWISINAQPLFVENEEITGAIVTFHDATTRRQFERQMRDSEKRWRSLAENIPDYVFMVDRTGCVLFINHVLFGFTLDEVLGAHISKLMPWGFSLTLTEGIEEIFRGAEKHECQIMLASGKERALRWYECHLSPVKQGDRIIAVIIRASDNTEKRFAEEESLRHERERNQLLDRWQRLIDSMPIGCIVWDLEGNILSANPSAERIFGYSAQQLLERKIDIITNQRAEDMIKRHSAMSANDLIEVIVSHNQKQQSVTCEWHSTPVLDAAGNIQSIISMMMDIGERAALEEQLRQAQKMDAIGKLAGGIAHDFNNILTAIMGYAELLTTRLPSSDPNSNYVQQIKKASQRAAALTYQLLAFSRKQVLQMKQIALQTVIGDLESLLRRLIGEHIDLVFQLDRTTPDVVMDASQLEQIIMNLTVNARDAMPTGGTITISLSPITIDANSGALYTEVPAGDYAHLSVQDTGCGIPTEIRQHIFEPFFTTKPDGKGTGLGLSVVFGVVRQSNGFILVESDVGKGSNFIILLPLHKKERTFFAERDSTAQLAIRGNETILLVEDDDTVRAFTIDTLKGSGYTVLSAPNGQRAIEMSASYPEKIDLLLTDVVMPHMGGREVADNILKQRPDIKVLFVSGYTDDMVLAHGVAEGTKAFLEKPFTAPKLLGRIRKVLMGAI